MSQNPSIRHVGLLEKIKSRSAVSTIKYIKYLKMIIVLIWKEYYVIFLIN
jgi:hypothetical protein